MNINSIKKALTEKFPTSQIFENKIDGETTEILCEVEPSSNHPEYSLAVAVIDRSSPHYHKVTKENYKVLKGKLQLYIEDEVLELHEGNEYTIEPRKIHFAQGDETWVEVRSEPGWTAEDHILKTVDK